jgi:hypothetical protein
MPKYTLHNQNGDFMHESYRSLQKAKDACDKATYNCRVLEEYMDYSPWNRKKLTKHGKEVYKNFTLFKGTQITTKELTSHIVSLYKKFSITELRYYGSRMNGGYKKESYIDVYLVTKKSIKGIPLFEFIYKDVIIEVHNFMDLNDGYVPSWISQYKNELF